MHLFSARKRIIALDYFITLEQAPEYPWWYSTVWIKPFYKFNTYKKVDHLSNYFYTHNITWTLSLIDTFIPMFKNLPCSPPYDSTCLFKFASCFGHYSKLHWFGRSHMSFYYFYNQFIVWVCNYFNNFLESAIGYKQEG